MKKYSVISVILAMLLLLSVCMFAVSCNSNQDPDSSTDSASQEETVPESGENQTSGETVKEDENDYPDSPVNAANDDIAEDDFS